LLSALAVILMTYLIHGGLILVLSAMIIRQQNLWIDLVLIPILNQSAIFVGSVVGFLNVCTQYASSPPPCRLNIIFDLEMVL
jgi:hypothetical protein